MILQAYIDESGSRNQDSYFVMSGFISPAEEWVRFSDEWQACLDAEPALSYFKMREANNPSGAFRNWKRDAIREKVRALVQIIKRHAKIAIHCTTPLDIFDATLGALPGPLANPYCHNFTAIMAGSAWEAIDQAAEGLDLIFDEQDKHALLLKSIYPIFKAKVDPELRGILPTEPMFRSDREFLPLQAADMLAWLFRNAFNGRRSEWEWIATELHPSIPMSRWSSIFTHERMQNIARLSKDITFTEDEARELRRIAMLTNSTLSSSELEQFDSALDAILRADPKAVKEEMDREKREKKQERESRGEKKRGRHSDKQDA